MSIKDLQDLRRELLVNSQKGLDNLYTHFKSECLRVLVSNKYCSADTAEGLYTEAILILRENILSGKVTELSNPVSYLISTCRNLIRNEARHEARNVKKVEQVRLLLYENSYELEESILQKEEMLKVCKQSLATLSERCQQILMAYYVHNLKMKEIASELGLASGDVAKTIKSRCYKSWIQAAEKLMK